MAKRRAHRSITSLDIRVGDPPKAPALCPICNCPVGPVEEEATRVARCARCGVKYHEPCFWRVLPLEEWVEYIQWAMETNEEEDQDNDEDEEEEGVEMVCAACREKSGA